MKNEDINITSQKRAPKVLFIATEYAGGMRPYAWSILNNMCHGDNCAIIVARDESVKSDFDTFNKENIFFVDYPQGKASRIRFRVYPKTLVDKIEKVLEEKDIDLVYNLTGELVLASYIKRLMKRVKVLHTVHDAIPHDTKYLSLGQYLNDKIFLEKPDRFLIKSAKHVVTNSKAQLDYLKKIYPKRDNYYAEFPSLVVPNIETGAMEVPELKGISNYILFFGNIQLYKGIHLLYDLYCNNPDLHKYPLVIAGNAPLYFPRKENEPGKVIHIKRFVDDRELRDLFTKAAISVYPYISATQSGVLSLSSYFGTKMILSDVPYFRSIVDSSDEGIRLVDVNNQDKFHDALSELLNTNESTLSYYSKRYSPDSWHKELTQITNNILYNKI